MYRPSPVTPYQRERLRAEEERFYAQDFGLLPPELRRLGASVRRVLARVGRRIAADSQPAPRGPGRHPA